MNPKTSVSLIIVNWNGRRYLEACLDSVFRQTMPFTQVILVDNASTDDSIALVRRRYPAVIMVALDSNRGFTGGNIEGLKYATGDHIALLNTDAVLDDRWLEKIIPVIEKDPEIGMCASRIIIQGTDLIDSAGDRFTTAFNGTKMGEYESADSYGEQRLVHGACAAAVLYRKRMLNEIGFLDDDFYFNHEDTDLNMRAWLSGWKCMYLPEAIVHHAVSASLGTFSDRAVYYFARNTVWVWLKNAPLTFMVLYLPQRLFYEIVSLGYFGIIKGKLRPFLRGKIDAFAGMNRMIGKRKAVRMLRKLTFSQTRRGLMPITTYLYLRLRNVNKSTAART